MRDLLAEANREVLEQYACSRTLLALDFDGTLAPIVDDPRRAAMRPSTRRLLRQAARAYPCVILSGRARADVARRVGGASVEAVIGNHGMEHGRLPAGAGRTVRLWTRRLEGELGGLPGVAIEDKGASLAVHYRASRQKKRARARILEAAQRLGDVRLIGGKDVVNVLPAGAPHKGLALERARARFGCDTAIYVGDDDTDEDVFSLDQPGRLLAIRVGRRAASAAAYYLRSQRDVDRVLRRLVSLRPKAGARVGSRSSRTRRGRP
jgi:trehalose 6-phosphate phosphatase